MASRAAPVAVLFVFSVLASLLAAGASAAAAGADSAFVLAAARTQRKDPLDGLRYYAGGWNISSEHYWASVGFSAAPVFAAAGVWFALFGAALFLAGCCFCCFPSRSASYSRAVISISLLLLLVFTAAAAVGCGVLYDGQGRFHGSTAATVDYVVARADETAGNLRDFSGFLKAAKAAGIGPVSLPDDVKGTIDDVVRKVSAASDELADRTASNSARIRAALDTIRKILIVLAAAMLILAFAGLVFSACGLESLIYLLVFLGWIMVTATLVLGGTFLLLHNVVGDTCVAMGEWVQRPPQEHTALDDILPCVDTAAAAEALNRSKEVNYRLVAVLNGVIANVSNADNLLPQAAPLYYNQSGPHVPLLCNPYTPGLLPRACSPGELPLISPEGPAQAWQAHVCQTAPGTPDVCATPGRLTPAMYTQMVGAANVSYGIARYGPVMADVADCEFVRQAFRSIEESHCPGLGKYSEKVYRGLLIVAGGLVVSLVMWVVHSRERRRRRDAREMERALAPASARAPGAYKFQALEEKGLLGSPIRR
ncbi:hypothetical protein BRADI_3g06197v3 [Brachypodium distachyon]|uniref:Uncharacterized protein n=1 Tax=Brachypodium distachyon TaxID=15368 RepID=I1HY11_BRADI|nr:hypothetical protein BRADI_3g06197v3 [Brachypodium distachyon]